VKKKLVLGVSVALFSIGATVAWAAPATESVPDTENSQRTWGDTRYETALAISQEVWDVDSTLLVFLATGENFPDALALGASTFGAGPILLVQHDQVPDGVADEVERLAPCGIVVVGGPGVVNDSVVQALDEFADPSTPKCELPTATDSSDQDPAASLMARFANRQK